MRAFWFESQGDIGDFCTKRPALLRRTAVGELVCVPASEWVAPPEGKHAVISVRRWLAIEGLSLSGRASLSTHADA